MKYVDGAECVAADLILINAFTVTGVFVTHVSMPARLKLMSGSHAVYFAVSAGIIFVKHVLRSALIALLKAHVPHIVSHAVLMISAQFYIQNVNIAGDLVRNIPRACLYAKYVL